MAPKHKGASRSAKFSDASNQQSSDESWQHEGIDTPSEGGLSKIEDEVKLLPIKMRETEPSSSNSNDQTTSPIHVPDNERDVSQRIEELLASNRNFLPDAFDTDLEDGDSRRWSLDSDDYGFPSDRGLLLKGSKSEHEPKRFGWKSLFRLHSWWNVLALFTIAIVIVWLAIRGLPWSSVKASKGLTVSCLCNFPSKVRFLIYTENGPLVPYTSRRN
jgi:beta-glucosidase